MTEVSAADIVVDRVPGRAAVGGDLDPGDHAAACVGRGPADGHGRTVREGGTLRRRRDRRSRRGRIGRLRGRRKPRHQRGRLHVAHVGEQVHRRLLHGRIGWAARVAGPLVQAPRPLHRPGAEHQGAARRHGTSVRWWVAVLFGWVLLAVVSEDLRAGVGGRGHVHQPGGPEPVVGVHVPLIAERADPCIERGGLAGRQAGHPGVAPEPELAVLRRHGDVGRAGVDVEQLPGQRVLRLPAVARRAEPRIHPGARPGGRVLRIGRWSS